MYFLFLDFFFVGFICLVLGSYLDFYGGLFEGIWILSGVDYVVFGFDVFLDSYGVLFMGVIFLVSSVILFYSYVYLGDFKARFCYMMVLFVFSMLLLVISPNLFSMILGWDGLGVVSFCLVGFYYGSDYSLDCSMITMLYNRLGDSFILVSLGFCYFLGGFSFVFFDCWFYLLSLFLILGLCTKSAQYPFVSWLPKAMAAPTPVSSLVHSSTLVTSGMYILFRFNFVLDGLFFFLFFISLLTVVIGGVLSLISFDVKKVIAYSTLSQMGFMLNSLSLGGGDFMYFHMLIHAVFKSTMFMCAGVIIHLVGFQDLRLCGGMLHVVPLTIYILVLSIFCLLGFPFVSGFYSKDIIVDYVFSGAHIWGFFVLYFLGISLTMSYSVRLFYYLVFSGCSYVPLVCLSEGPISYCMVVLYFGSVFYGCVLLYVFFDFSLFGGLGFLISGFILLCLFLGIVLMYLSFSVFLFWAFTFFYFIDGFFVLSKLWVLGFVKGFILLDVYWLESLVGLKFYRFLSGFYVGVSWLYFNYIFALFLLLFFFLFFLCSCNLF